MNTPELHIDEKHRLEALRQYGVLDTLPEQALDDLTALAAHICGPPGTGSNYSRTSVTIPKFNPNALCAPATDESPRKKPATY